MSQRQHMLPVWFFIGLLLSAYGIIIFITSILAWSQPSAAVLSQYHPGVWGGILLMLIGGFYVLHFRPGKKPDR
jgi:FtsH-binding integral membrane protein